MDTSNAVPTHAGKVSPCGEAGFTVIQWAAADDAERLAADLRSAGVFISAVTKNPHLSITEVRRAVTSSHLLATVTEILGPVVAIENTFLMVKDPGGDFAVPTHQDGINGRLVLHPEGAIAVWMALTPANPMNGGLEVAIGSQQDGYVDYRRSAAPGRPLAACVQPGLPFTGLELTPGQACVMDVRLLHRSGLNRSTATRAGINVRYVAPGGIHVRSGPRPVPFPAAGIWPAADPR